jgi:SAM-dependent methyltransferase
MTKHVRQNTFYDHYAKDRPTKFGMALVRNASRKVFDFAEAQKASSILEIGPGRGAFADICLGHGIEYWAVEPNQKMADDLERRGATVQRIIVPPLTGIQRKFDLVVMSSVLEHMDTMSMALSLAKQVHEILNPNGRFVIYSPDYMNWKHHFFLVDFSHNYVTTWRRVEGLLVSAGFENIRGTYMSGPLIGSVSLLTSVLARILPFGWLNVLLPESKLTKKLYKLQVSFLRGVLMFGEKSADQQSNTPPEN